MVVQNCQAKPDERPLIIFERGCQSEIDEWSPIIMIINHLTTMAQIANGLFSTMDMIPQPPPAVQFNLLIK
jgi:hypothetical protein